MGKVIDTEEFMDKFNMLSTENQRYIVAIQQALIFAQSNEGNAAKQNKCNAAITPRS